MIRSFDRRFGRIFTVVISSFLLATGLALADPPHACKTCGVRAEPQELKAVEHQQGVFADIAQKFGEPQTERKRVFDGIFLFDIRQEGKAVSVSGMNGGQGLDGPLLTGFTGSLYEASRGRQPYIKDAGFQPFSQPSPLPPTTGAYGPGFYGAWLGVTASPPPLVPVPGLTPARNFKQSMALIRENASKLSREDKLLFLNQLGADLSAGYDYSVSNNPFNADKTALEQVFQNFSFGGPKGGVCRDIAAYLAEAARALGFESVGTHSGLNGPGNDVGAHVVSHFRDPATGEYYMQNYGRIFNTHQKNLQGAVDVSTRVLGALSGVSYVESLPGRTHLYTPKLARWIEGKIDAFAERQPDPAYFTAKVSDRETTLGLQYQAQGRKGDKDRMVKGFFLRSQVETSEGPVRIQAIGVSGDVSRNVALSDSVLDEVGYAAKSQFGYFQLKNRKLDPNTEMGSQKKNNVFFGVNLAGKARIDQVTGKLELEARVLDAWKKTATGAPLSGVAAKLTPAVEYKLSDVPVSISAARTFEVVPRDQYSKMTLQAAYDKVSVVVDRRGADQAVGVVSNSEAYLFGGAERMDAVALRQLFKVSVPTERKGEFAVVLDLNKIVQNRSQDPFYDMPGSASLRGEWKKALGKLLEIGTGVEARYGSQPFFLFEQPGSVLPDLAVRKKTEVKGDLWLRMLF